MAKRDKLSSGRVLATAGITLALGVIIWALVAYAASTVGTYSSNTYATPKASFGRGVDTVYTKMVGGFATKTYQAEYWGPSTDDGTDKVFKVKQTAALSNAAGEYTDNYAPLDTVTTGFWQTRVYHNPRFLDGSRVVITGPAKGRLNTSTSYEFSWVVLDREGNIIKTDLRTGTYLYISFYYANKRIVRANATTSNTSFNSTTGEYTYITSGGYTLPAAANNTIVYFRVTSVSGYAGEAAEAGEAAGTADAYTMGSMYTQENWFCDDSGTATPSAPIYFIEPLTPTDTVNAFNVANPPGGAKYPAVDYTFYSKLYNADGTEVTSGTFTWTRTAVEADDYDASGTATTYTGTAPVYDSVAGAWKTTVTLPAPGKYRLRMSAVSTATCYVTQVINYAATGEFNMLGDVTPPANVSGLTPAPSDNRVTTNWTNPGDADFSGILILRNTASITNAPTMGQQYSVDGATGPNTIGTSRVVYVGNGTQLIDGDPCGARLDNGTTYYYKVFSYDTLLNYSAGVQTSATPADTAPTGPVTGAGFIESNMQNTVTWTNPVACDYAGAIIRYRTDGSFPSARDGSDGSLLAGTKVGGASGAANSFSHTNLTNGTPYYYTIWAYDDEVSANWSTSASPSTYAVPHDVTAPSAVSDLGVVPGSVTAFDVTLQWTATGDDGLTGNASAYEIRYANTPIDSDTAWNNAWHTVGENLPQPLPAGSLQSYKVAGLSPLTQYYFAIKVADEVFNQSGISDSPTTTTLCNPDLTACNQCHLMPPDDDLPGAHPRGTGNIGAHYLPIHAGGGDAEQCNVCHADGLVWRNNTTLYKFNHQNDVIDINPPGKIGNQYERDNSIGGTFYMQTTIVYKYKNYSSGVGVKQMTGYCQNTYCHGAGLSSPRWGLEGIVCGEYCHETPPATGRHVKHYHPGQYYINFGPMATQVSGYTNDDGSSGWTGTAPVVVNRGTNPAAGGNRDLRYSTFIKSSNATKTFTLPDGTWYVTVCSGDPAGTLTHQTVQVSGNGGTSWTPLVDDFDTLGVKLFKKAVDHQVIVSGGNNLMVKIGNGSVDTALNYMIINGSPEAPKSNNTLLQNTPSEYGFACGKCHVADATQAKHTIHVGGPVQRDIRDAENAFDANSFPKNPFAVYTQIAFAPISTYLDGQGFNYTNGRSCINTYCHGGTLNSGGTNHSPNWKDGYIDVTGASLCGSCHDAGYADSSPLTNMSTGSHKKHTNKSAAYRYDCYKCHYHTVGAKNPGTGIIPITDKTHHVNGDVDAVFDPNDDTMKFGRYSTAVKTCESVYCHSNGLLDESGQPFWATTYAVPVWASGAKTCNYCHGNGRSDGMPHYANNTATPNSHEMHVVTNNLACSKCHYDTTRTGSSIYTTIQPAQHVDGAADVSFDAQNPSGTYSHASNQCSNTYCHGLSAPPAWGGVVTCGSCHGVSPTNPNPGIGAHDAHSQGNHGNISTIDANKSTAANYDFDCRFCHFSRNHGAGETNPGVQTAETNFNTIDVTNGYNNTGGIYTPGASKTDGNNWHYTVGTCSNIKCHSNGRGGAPNNTFYTWTSKTLGTNCAGCHNGTAAATNKISTDRHSKHVWSSLYRFKCGDCHSTTCSLDNLSNRTNHVNGRPDVALDAVWGGTYNSGAKTCDTVGCHFNGDPTAWGGQLYYVQMSWTSGTTTCTSCHSDRHSDAGDGVRTGPQTLSHNHGEHLNSVANNGYGSRFGCTNCHQSTATSNTTLSAAMPTTHNNRTKEVYFTVPFYNMSGPNTLTNYTTTGDPKLGYWGAYSMGSTGSCTVICHSDGRGGNPIAFPNWSTPEGSYGCTSCHAADATTFAMTNYTAKSFAHVTHLNNGVTCNICHRLTASSNTMINASGFNAHHVNGGAANDVKLALGTAGTYNTGTKTCSGLTCHGDRVWTTHYASNCSSCHDSPPRYAQHFAHYSALSLGNLTGVKANNTTNNSNATNYMFGCGKCHTSNSHNTGNVTTNQAAEVKFDGTVNPMNPLGKYTTLGALWATDARGKPYTAGTCNNLYCHSDGKGTYANIAWNTASVSCTSCHGGATSATLSTPHNKHVNTLAAGSYNIGCAQCHKKTVSSNTVVSNKANHVNGAKEAFFLSFGNMTGYYNGVNCSVTYCHSDGTGTSKTPAWSGSMTCISCHNYTKATTEITTGKHKEHLNNASDANLGSFRCVDCHNDTVMANNTAIIYTNGTHVNNVKNINFVDKSLNNFTGAYVSGSFTCRNNYCHSSGQKMDGGTGSFANLSTPKFRVPAWNGAALDCKGCHGADSGFASLFGEPNYANRSTSGTMSGAWFNGHQKHVKTVADCYGCHNTTVTSAGNVIAAGGNHINGSREVSFSGGGTYNAGAKRCTNTSCHGTTVMRWGGALPKDCQSCHSDMGSGTYGNHSSTGKHAKHVNSATYKYACEMCHAAKNSSGNTAHAAGDVSANQAAEVVFHSATTTWKTMTYGNGGTAFRYIQMDSALGLSHSPGYAAGALGGSDPVNTNRKYTQGRCSNVWCHSNANPLGGANTYATYANWSTAETANCGSCHASGTAMSSGKHTQHVNNGDLGKFSCSKCHTDTVRANASVYNYNYHVDGVKNVNFTSIVLARYTGFYVSASYTCRNTYCHSSGQASSGTMPNYSTPVALTPAWNGAALDCKGCHGVGSTFGQPNYTNRSTSSRAWFNGHGVSGHVSSAADCSKCHRGTTNVLGNLSSNTVKHINGARDLNFRSDISGMTYNTTNKSCTGSAGATCHASSTMRWGGTADCKTCHAVSAAETNDFAYGNATKATINFEQFTAVGHGKKANTFRYSGNTAPNLSCESSNSSSTVGGCHRPATGHGIAGNPFRLVSSGTIKPTDPNALCATTCHTSPGVKNHVKSITGGTKYATWFFDPKCVDCHDPHGDNGGNDTTQRNYAMIQGFINYSTNSSAYGVPTQTRAMDFPAETTRPASKTRASYVTATFDGICQICHRRNASVVFNRNQNQSHNGTQLCSDCHTSSGAHNEGFKGVGGDCLVCHTTGGAPTTSGRQNITAEFAKKSHHVNSATVSIRTCAMCHAEGNVDGSVNSTYHNTAGKAVVLNVWNGAFTNGTGIAALMAGRSFVRYTSGYGSSAGMAVSNATKLNAVCISCHNRTNANSTPFKASGDTNKPTVYAAWTNGTSIQARYFANGTSFFSKYSPANYNVVPQIAKSLSPHGNPDKNRRGVKKGVAWTDDRSAAQPQVACFDCHNSHGSRVGSYPGNTLPLTSYSSVLSGKKGGLMKEYTTTSSSYTVKSYMPKQGGGGNKPVVYSASSAACFDCHLGDNAKAPRKMTNYNNRSSIEGYYDAGRWQKDDKWAGSFTYKTAGAGKGSGRQYGSHFGGTSTVMTTTPMKKIDGRCVMCHDPHGVAPNSGNAAYRLPALKGTWLTSPYKEDRAPKQGSTSTLADPNANALSNLRIKYPVRESPSFNYNNPSIVGAGYGKGAGTGYGTGGTGHGGYFIDDNTFGTNYLTASGGTVSDTATANRLYTNVTARRMKENTTQFAGLCLQCHDGSTAGSGIRGISDTTTTPTVRVHRTVKGWSGDAAAADIFTQAMARYQHNMSYQGTNSAGNADTCTSCWENLPSGYRWSVKPPTTTTSVNRSSLLSAVTPNTTTGQGLAGYTQPTMHQFPCSKCHTAHTSKLPRLMKTNCLDVGTSTTTPKHGNAYTYINCETNASTKDLHTMTCHNEKKSNVSGTSRGWNSKTGW